MENLLDVTDDIKIPESCNSYDIMNDEEIQEIIESSMVLLDNFVQDNIRLYDKPQFQDTIRKFIRNIVNELIVHYIEEEIISEDVESYMEEHIDDIIECVYEQYFAIVPAREYEHTYSLTFPDDKESIAKELEVIEEKNKKCPPQRSEEWYEFRNNVLSASTLWKAIGSEKNKNSLIVDKCKPISHFGSVNINTPFHWGQKYEPVSTLFYEHKYDAQINEYGCIPHNDYSFLGASPDGINVKKDSVTYGRMLEIKNIFNREITGIPKKEYWIQTQLQMEVCNLEMCDFLETEFVEYENEDAFNKDGTFLETEDGKLKGVIMMFYVNQQPHYEYKPITMDKEEFKTWEQEQMEAHKDDTWVKNNYFYLKKYSCVCILRNKEWFDSIAPGLVELWDTILHERVHGYEHRKVTTSKQKKNKVTITKTSDPLCEAPQKGLLGGKLIIKIDT